MIRDKTSGDSLQYAFVEFATKEDCERAYFKMQGVLIDDHRIHVDFSQSVSKLSTDWRQNSKSNSARGRGGFGGIDSLERRKQYRGEEGGRNRGDKYDYVFDKEERRRRGEPEEPRGKPRSRSPPRRDQGQSRYERDRGGRDRYEPSRRGGDDRDSRKRSPERRRSRDRHDGRRR